MKRANSVDEYIARKTMWSDELARLRAILTATELEETVKWGAPCYMIGGRNVVGVAAFKSYFGLWFHQGALLSDPAGVLVNAQEGVTRAQRQWRMRGAGDIDAPLIGHYAAEAIGLAKAGERVAPEPKRLVVPAELAAALASDAAARGAFAALTPGRQREYADHVASAKREQTRRARAEKVLPMIAAGGGLYDRYRESDR